MSLLRRRLNVFDLTLITVGGIIGSGIFRNPALVAARAHLPWLILACWIAGGILALIGTYVYAELGTRHPVDGGTYAFLRDAFHPVVAFTFGWSLLLIVDTGGTAASAVLFSTYLGPLTGAAFNPKVVAAVTIAIIAFINCLGVRQGGTWQNLLVALKTIALAALILTGLLAHPVAATATPLPPLPGTGALFGAFAIAMLPVLFAYNGFQSASYVTGEAIEPRRTVPRGLLLGISTVITIYVLVSVVCLRMLGPAGLAATKAPASDVMQAAFGMAGARFIALAIAISTLGFMSTRLLVAPRIYYQMARDGTFFHWLAWVHPRTAVPVFAILAEGAVAAVLALSGSFEQIVNWVVGPEWIFVIAVAAAVFVFRKRDGGKAVAVQVPLHPWSTSLLIAVLAAILVAEFVLVPLDSLYGTMVIVAGAAFYFVRKQFAATA